jgi:ferredoxin-thioredoxin reductase catalytic subunit
LGLIVKLNDDEEHVKRIREGIKKSGGYCPCVPKHLHTSDDVKCPCKAFRERKECCCELYITVNTGGSDEADKKAD